MSLFVKYLFDNNERYNSFFYGAGLAKKNDSQDFNSFTYISFILFIDNLDRSNFQLSIQYPMDLSFVPKDNNEPNNSYMFVPSIILDGKDVYINASLNFIHRF